MRIVGGKHRGRKIPVPPSHVRPTSERVREAIMNILGPTWTGLHILDCFAGSGAFGFETLSRQAKHVTFIETQRSICNMIEKTAETLMETDNTTVLHGDATSQMKKLIASKTTFDVLFFDPPYRKELLEPCLALATQLASHRGKIIAEHAPEELPPEDVAGLVLYDRRRYGSTALTFYERS